MGTKPGRINPLIIIVASLGISLILFIIILIATRKLWAPFEEIPTTAQQPSQTSYPTYTYYPTLAPLPTYTLFETLEIKWIRSELPLYNIPVEIPANWNILPINHRREQDSPGMPNSHSKECEDYLIIGPDGKQIITVTIVCWFGEGIGGGCPDDIQIALEISDDLLLGRWADPENNSFIYGRVTYGDLWWNPAGGKGYNCMSEYPIPYTYQVLGKPYYEITDFSTVDRIIKSLAANIPSQGQ